MEESHSGNDAGKKWTVRIPLGTEANGLPPGLTTLPSSSSFASQEPTLHQYFFFLSLVKIKSLGKIRQVEESIRKMGVKVQDRRKK